MEIIRDETIYYTVFESPLDPLLLTSDGAALTGLFMRTERNGARPGEGWVHDDGAAPFAEAKRQLAAYFDGRLTAFDLPLAPRGTGFQTRVWDALLTIPYGATASYGEIARRLGNGGGARAVGLANGRNPISIVVPCHRVIGADGSLTGYGGGLPRKRALLAFESTVLAEGPRSFQIR